MDLKILKVGPERANCYILSQENGETIVIDPGGDSELILAELAKIQNLNLRYLLLTHGHFDHVLAVDDLKSHFLNVDVIIGEADVELLRMVPEQGLFVGKSGLKSQKSEVAAVSDGDFLPFGDDVIKIIGAQGHTKGSLCFLINDMLFTGDTLFYHTVGRTDLPAASEDELKKSLDKLLHLPPDIYVLPGHGRSTHIGEEKAYYGVK